MDFNKEELVQEAKTWDQTYAFYVTKDLEYKDIHDVLYNTGIENSVASSPVVNVQIKKL